MPVTIRSAFTPLTSVVDKYITSQKARAKAQQQARDTTSGPTGAQVDAQVASTLTRGQGIRYLAGQQDHLDISPPLAAAQVDSEGRTLGLEDPNDAALQDDPATQVGAPATARPFVVATTSVTDPALLQEVAEVTYGRQTSIPLFSAPSPAVGGRLVPPNQYGFTDPRTYGGTSFDLVGNGMHEPLNVIISSLSHPTILTRKGFQSYLRSLSFDRECLGLHAGGYQKGFIDPRGWRDQELIYRQVYTPLDHVFGTCIESLLGGNHVRAWQQQATGAWFLATSKEQDASKHHMIVPNGYNRGRNELVRQALGKARDGRTSFMLTSYETEVVFVAGLMPQGVQGVNHDIAVDGLTAVLTVKVVQPEGWLAKKVAPNAAAYEARHDGEATEPVAAADVREAEESKKPKRMSLAKRFSLGAAPKSALHVNESKSQPIWSKLKSIAVPKHQKANPAASNAETTGDTLVAATEDHHGPSSVDSTSTAADVDPTAAKTEPRSLIASTPPLPTYHN